jgi:hypothetical protein
LCRALPDGALPECAAYGLALRVNLAEREAMDMG